MIIRLKKTLSRSQDTLLQDAAGMAALVVIMVVALHMPALN